MSQKRLLDALREKCEIRSFFWSVFSSIRTEYRKIWTRKKSVFGHFFFDNFLKKRPWHRCFPVNFAKFLRAPFFIAPVKLR